MHNFCRYLCRGGQDAPDPLPSAFLLIVWIFHWSAWAAAESGDRRPAAGPPRGVETRGTSVISCAERPGATPKLLPATRTHARAPEAAERAPGAHAGALKPSHALGDDQKNVECQIAAASGCGYLEHLECSHQPHIQGRGAKKRTQRAG